MWIKEFDHEKRITRCDCLQVSYYLKADTITFLY